MTQPNARTSSAAPAKDSLPSRFAVYVRLSEVEYRSLASDAVMFGKNIPEMLREGYFRGGGGITVLMPSADTKALLVALSRVGNNLNQIARQLNQGSPQRFSEELRYAAEELGLLNGLVSRAVSGSKAKYGEDTHGDS